jgi:hypothetical protein
VIVKREEVFTQPFVLTSDDLDGLAADLSGRLSKLDIDIKCADKLTRSFTSFQELKVFENPQGREIRELRISGRTADYSIEFSFWLTTQQRRNIYLNLKGDEETAIALNQAVIDRLHAMRPWYAWIALMNWYWMVIALWFTFNLGAIFALFKGTLYFRTLQEIRELDLSYVLRSFGAGLLPLLVGVILRRVQNFVFPMGSFALGYGARRHAKGEFVRTGVIIAFLMSLAASLVAVWLV